jgi:hypothetical protein
MFFDPANTGLVILGASQFQEDPHDNNRAVFRKAYEEVLKFFANGRLGPGLSSRNVFDGFDQDLDKDELIGRLERFIEKKRFDDLFVYICSHGLKDGAFFGIQLVQTDTKNPDTYIRFSRLRDQITAITKARVYFIIDACFSGLAHEKIDLPKISPEALQYVTGIRGDMLPDGGVCVLTSNSPEYVGRTIADDGRSDIFLPLFTHELLEVLKKGAVGQSEYGLSIDHLRTLLDARIEKKLLENGDWEEGKPRADTPFFSDIPRLEPGKVGLLSRLFLFQNNHETKYLVNEAARRFRGFYSRMERKEELLEKREKQLKELTSNLERTEDAKRKTDLEVTLLSLKNQRLEESIFELSERVKRYFFITISFIVLVILCSIGAIYFIDQIFEFLRVRGFQG